MTNRLLIPMLSVAFALCTLNACKKDDSPAPTRSQLIIGTWNINAYGVDDNMNGNLESSEYDAIPAGSGLTETFRSDGTGVITTTAPGGSPTPQNITWSLTNSDQNLQVVSSSGTTNATITRLTEHELMGYDPSLSPRTIYLLTK